MTHHRSTRYGGRALVGAAVAGTVVVLALATTACNDAATKPTAGAPAIASAAPTPTVLANPAGQALLDDARNRLLPSLGEQALRGRLQDRLRALAAALDAGDESGSRRQLALTRKLVKASVRRGDGADLASLTLALDEIEAQLDAPATQPASTQP